MSHLNRLLLWIGLFMLALRAPAQLTVSTIRGTATDPSGSAVSGANITLVNLGTNIQRMVVTNENGDFEIPDLQRGTYRLTTSHASFKNWVAENIILESNQIRRIDVTLELGAVGAEVTVRADDAVISTESAKIQSTFTNKRFDDAPLVGDGRNPQMVLTTPPLVQSTGGVYGIQVSGQPAGQVEEGIDGHTGVNVHVYSEVALVQGNNSAEFSRLLQSHHEIRQQPAPRARHLMAPELGAIGPRLLRRNQGQEFFHTMHADVSGPVCKDKTFFYVSSTAQRFPAPASS